MNGALPIYDDFDKRLTALEAKFVELEKLTNWNNDLLIRLETHAGSDREPSVNPFRKVIERMEAIKPPDPPPEIGESVSVL